MCKHVNITPLRYILPGVFLGYARLLLDTVELYSCALNMPTFDFGRLCRQMSVHMG